MHKDRYTQKILSIICSWWPQIVWQNTLYYYLYIFHIYVTRSLTSTKSNHSFFYLLTDWKPFPSPATYLLSSTCSCSWTTNYTERHQKMQPLPLCAWTWLNIVHEDKDRNKKTKVYIVLQHYSATAWDLIEIKIVYSVKLAASALIRIRCRPACCMGIEMNIFLVRKER